MQDDSLKDENKKLAEKSLTNEQIASLVVDAQAGNAEAFGEIYDFYVQKIYRYIYFKVDQSEALDLTESVFLKAWEHLRTYKKGQHAFSAWLFRIAHNLVVDYHRFNKFSIPLDNHIQDHKRENNPEFITEQSLSREGLKIALNSLKKSYRQIILLKYINELENHEIAQIMGKTEGSLRVLKHRALQELKKILVEKGIKY